MIDNERECRKLQIRELQKIHGTEKQLSRKKASILSDLSDPEKVQQHQEIADKVYLSVLDTEVDECNNQNFKKQVLASLTPEDSDSFNEFKNASFYKSVALFEKYSAHQVQKSLVKEQYMGKRGVKKQKTLNQLLDYLIDCKVRKCINTSLVNYQQMESQRTIQSQLESTGILLKDSRKQRLLVLMKSTPKYTQQTMADDIGVNISTIKRWVKELSTM